MISGPAGRFVGLRGPFLWVLAGFLAWCAEAGQSFWLAARRRPNLFLLAARRRSNLWGDF